MIISILRTFGRFGQSLRPQVLRRGILSEAYNCDSAWNERLQGPAFKKVVPSDLGLMISQKLDNGEPVSPIDMDVYVNLIHRLDVTSLWFVEDLLRRFRKTQQCLDVLDSTSHAVVRGLLQHQEHERLMTILRSKVEFGVFLDDVSAALVMSSCLERGDAATAAQVAYELMLQEEEFAKLPLLTAVSLRSCQLHWKAVREAGGWPPMEAATEEVDEDDIEYVVVKFVRNDNFDEHFDLTEDRLLLGKTLLSLHAAVGDPVVANAALLLGLAMFEKFGRLREEVQRLIDGDLRVPGSTIADVLFLLQSTPTLPEGEENGPRKRHFVTEDEKEGIVAEFEELLPKLPTSDGDFHERSAEYVASVIAAEETDDIQRVQRIYKGFSEERDAKIEAEMKELRQQGIHDEAKQRLRQLLDREELLHSYENRADIDYAAWLAPRSRAEKRRSRREEWQKDIDNIPKTRARTFLDYD